MQDRTTTVRPNDDEGLSLEGVALAPIDRLLPNRPAPFLILVSSIALGCWLLGLALAPSIPRFLASNEWSFQPLYIVAHLVALRLFVSVFTTNFRKAVVHLDVPPGHATRGIRLALGPAGALAALAIAVPFAASDYMYLHSDSYETAGKDGLIRPADLFMWGIWCAEWFINALIWVLLVGFMVKNCITIAMYRFRAPIEVVVHEQHFRPFLLMSQGGASIVLGFGCVTVLYIWYTGGAITDYLGLGITAALLVISFVPPWVMLKRKVVGAIAEETSALRHTLAKVTWDAGQRPAGPSAGTSQPLEERLNQALAFFRIAYLEQLNVNLGRKEARAIVLRLLAPVLTIIWQLTQNFHGSMQKIDGAWKAIMQQMGKLGGS